MPRRHVASICLAFAASAVSACYSGLSEGQRHDTAGGDGGTTGGDDGGSGGDDAGPEAGDCAGFDSGLRRLNLREYEHALEALLGDAIAIEGFPADDTAKGFDIDAGLLPVTDVWLAAHATAAESAIEAALAEGTSTRDAIMVCAPESEAEELACAEQILGAFGLRAWRRPVQPDEMTSLLEFLDVAATEGDGFEQGIRLALQATLLSPNFVFKVEQSRAAGDEVDPYELATRLAFFLWSGPPDEALLEAAAAGELQDPAGLRAQTQRMLADPRADSLTDGFAAQWLMLDELDGFSPLPAIFPDYDARLRDSMRAEAELTFATALADDMTLSELVSAGDVWVDETLAAHYGIDGVVGAEFRRVDGAGARRYGLLTQGAVLTLSSHPGQSSPTRRGLWVTDRLLCAPPPPPPPDVDNTLPEPGESGDDQTIREFLEQTHLADPACAGCHTYLDPVGFALEHYDGVGAFREAYANGAAIDDSGTFAGQTLDGAAGLSAAVAEHPELQTCVATYAIAYATNRGPKAVDGCLVEDSLDAGERVGLRSLLEIIVTHPAFAAAAVPEDA